MANDLSKLVVGDTTYDIKDATAARRNIYYGTCTTAANTYKKVATVETFPLDSNNKPLVGTVVAIKYSNTNTYKTEGQTYQLNVNSTGDYPMYYNNAALATSTSANTLVAGYKNRHIFYMFDGSHWVWLTASYDSNTTYSGMTQAEVDAGTGTTARLITPQRLRDNFYTEDEVDALLADKADAANLPTKTSELTNDSNFITSQRTLINMDDSDGLVFTDANGDALTHAQVRATLNDVGNDIIINYQGDCYSKTEADEDGWSLENLSLTICNYIDLAWDEDNIIIEYIGASDLNYQFVKQTRKINNKPLSTDITLTASDVGAMSTSHPANAITSVKISEWNAKADPVPIVTVSTTGAVTQALDPNKFYNFTGSPTSLTLTLNSGTGLCIYAGKFTAGTGFSNLSFPASVKVAAGCPDVEAGGVYEFSVMDNLLLLAKES